LICRYENRIMKPIKIEKKGGERWTEGELRKNNGREK
jgi:hypothetical protein